MEDIVNMQKMKDMLYWPNLLAGTIGWFYIRRSHPTFLFIESIYTIQMDSILCRLMCRRFLNTTVRHVLQARVFGHSVFKWILLIESLDKHLACCFPAQVSMWRAEAGLGLIVFGEFVEGETGPTQTNIWKAETLLGAAGAHFNSLQFPFWKLACSFLSSTVPPAFLPVLLVLWRSLE